MVGIRLSADSPTIVDVEAQPKKQTENDWNNVVDLYQDDDDNDNDDDNDYNDDGNDGNSIGYLWLINSFRKTFVNGLGKFCGNERFDVCLSFISFPYHKDT